MAATPKGKKPEPHKSPPAKPAATKKAAGVAASAREAAAKKQPTIADRIEAFGIEAICERLSNGVTMTAIAEEIGVTVGKLSQWIASDEEHSARAREARIHAARAAAKVERAETRRRKEAIKRKPDLMREADQAFAAYIRERDRQAGHPCISSGRPLDWASGNQVDAGHYRSRGAASHLRYHPDNCHAQSKYENRHRAGNAVEYRVGLIARIGLAVVEALEADNRVHHWTHDELRAIRDEYRAKLKQLTTKGGA